MSEVLFRGKQISGGSWVYGYPYSDGKKSYIAYEGEKDCIIHEVVPETVKPYTGLLDKNEKKIFEGDIVEVIGEDFLAMIGWCESTARFILDFYAADVVSGFDSYYGKECEVVGNIYDDAELIGGDQT